MMMKLLNFTIIKLTVCLIIGLLLSHYLNIDFNWVFKGIFTLQISLCVFFFIARKQFKKTIWFGLTAYFITITIGMLIYNLHDQNNFKSHYLQNSSLKKGQSVTIIFKVKALLKPNSYYNKYIVETLKIDNQTYIGKLMLNVKKDSLQNLYRVDDVLLLTTKLTNINSPLNPNQFDYRNYLEKKYIYRQITSKTQSIYTINSQRHTIFGYAEALREHINNKLLGHKFDPDVLAIINALLLGQRQNLSNEIYNDYVNAGAIHILAISGLHVGLILLILNRIFQPITLIKNGPTIKTAIIVLLLWCFAFVAGLSASVTRAVTMFSIVAVGMHLNRPSNIYNTLAISIFFLLLFKPMFLFDVGFQMSYLAVISIVSIQPVLYKLWHPKWTITDYLWQIFTVTIAAQFGVVPISLYYFHQFPGLFLASNMILIPCLGLLLGLGILIIILAVLNALPEIIASTYGSIISFMNNIINWISKQEEFLLKDISFNIFHVLTSYFFIVILLKLYKNKNYQNTRLFLTSLLVLQVVLLFNKFESPSNEFIIFNKSRTSILGHKKASDLFISHDKDIISSNNLNIIKNYRVQNFIKSVEVDTLETVYRFNHKTLLIVDSLGIYNVKHFKPNYILLKDSPKINLIRLIDSIKPQLIIADASNYKSYIKRWKATCRAKKIPFHYTNEKGAYIFKY